jgi:hypothetical protein
MIVVFAGAGASKSIGEDQYPTTAQFFAQLPSEISGNQLFANIVHFHQNTTPEKVIDIELILWSLADTIAGARAAQDPTTPLGFLLDGNRISTFVPDTPDLRRAVATLSGLVRMAEGLRDQIHEQIYKHYVPEPSSEGLKRGWVPLLTALANTDPQIQIFTTNYDCVLEHALQATNLQIETGRARVVYDRLDRSWWEGTWQERRNKLSSSSKNGLLTKLHGSVDWLLDSGTIYVGTPTFQGRHDERVILYPGFKGEPATEPFRSFHRHLADTVAEASLLVFVGFAFRDSHINSVLQRATSREAHIMLIDPSPEVQPVPYVDRSEVYTIRQKFDLDAVRSVVERLHLRAA